MFYSLRRTTLDWDNEGPLALLGIGSEGPASQ
jgi:hypothetical protein